MTKKAFREKMMSRRFIVMLTISLYIVLLLFTWVDYSIKLTGYATFEGALLYTAVTPLLILVSFGIRKIKSLKFWQLTWTALGVLIFGFVLYAIVNFLLYRVFSLPVWVEMDGLVRLLLTMPLSYVIGAYLGYKLGERRGFTPPLLQL